MKTTGRKSRIKSIPHFKAWFHSRDGPDTVLSPGELNKKAMRSMTVIAVMGIVLLFTDLLVSWNTDVIRTDIDPQTGQIFLIRPDEGASTAHMPVTAIVRSKEGSYEKDMDLTLSPYQTEAVRPENDEQEERNSPEKEHIMYELRSVVSDLDSDTSLRKVPLPSQLPGGAQVMWNHRRQSHTLFILISTVLTAVIVYKKRLLPLEKKKKEEYESTANCLPYFIHQLVLLLNAGLFLSDAFNRTVEENMRFEKNEKRFFYLKMRRIYESVTNTNGILHRELMDFARDSGVGELLRVSTVISDNVNKGTELVEKLERESESLWLSCKLKYEEQGRLTETRMTFPLTVFLGVLILITVAPALLEL